MKFPTSRRWQALAGAALLVIGGAAGTVAGHAFQRPIEMAPLHPITIRSLPGQSGIVTVRARVAETYGNKFVADDGSARTLVDLGRAGDEARLVTDGQTVTVQGRFDHSVLHASFLVDAGGSVHALGPVGHPHHDRHGPPPPHGPDGRDGPPRG